MRVTVPRRRGLIRIPPVCDRVLPQNGSAGRRPDFAELRSCCRAAARSGAYQARRLRGAGRSGSASRLGRRHLDRRHQRRHDRRQSAGTRGSNGCARSGRPSPVAARTTGSRVGSTCRRPARQLSTSGAPGAAVGMPGFFTPRMPPPCFIPTARPEALSYYDTAPLGDARAAGRFRSHQRRRDAASASARSTSRTGNSSISTARRTRSARAHHGQRRAAARLSGDRDRRRALLGWRHRLQHAAAMGARQPTRARTRWSSRSICGARAASCRAT